MTSLLVLSNYLAQVCLIAIFRILCEILIVSSNSKEFLVSTTA